MKAEQQYIYDDDDEASFDLNYTGFLSSNKRLNLDQVPDAVECSFQSSFDDSESLFVLDDEDDDETGNDYFFQTCGISLKSALNAIVNRQCYKNEALHIRCRESEGAVHHRVLSIDDGKKSVRFAIDPIDGTVKRSTKLYPKEASHAALWFSGEELEEIRSECRKMVNVYKTNHPKYFAAVLGMSFSYERRISQKDMSKFQDQVSDNSRARGLETFIVDLIQTFRKAHIDMVLTEQHDQRRKGCEFHKKGTEAIRRVARKTSRPSRQLARHLAAHDTFDAVKATLSPW